MELRVLSLYPEQMNIYADRGNILFLQRRCEWRGIGFAHAGAGPGRGASTRPPTTSSTSAAARTATSAWSPPTWSRASARRSPPRSTTAPSLLAVCGGYQLLGHSYQLGEETLPGLGLADLETVREPGPRLIGNVAIEVDLGAGPRLLAGFENHGGRTYLGAGAEPLGRVRQGPRQQRQATASRACAAHNLIGTYLHGPLLPKNAWLADHLIALALERRYGARPELEPLDDALRGRRPRERRAAAGRPTCAAQRPLEPKPPLAAGGVGQRRRPRPARRARSGRSPAGRCGRPARPGRSRPGRC